MTPRVEANIVICAFFKTAISFRCQYKKIYGKIFLSRQKSIQGGMGVWERVPSAAFKN